MVAKRKTKESGCIRGLDEETRKAVERATQLLEENAVYRAEAMSSPGAVRTYLKLKLAGLEREEFHVIWLDSQHRIMPLNACLSAPWPPPASIRVR